MGARRKGREFALQTLYLADISSVNPEKTLFGVISGQEADERIIEFSKRLVSGIIANREMIDDLIEKYTKNWEISRMAALDRNILRIGAYEMLFEADTPVSVIIDEAVEIAKIYSTADSGKFVNGILDKVKLERENKSSASNGTSQKP